MHTIPTPARATRPRGTRTGEWLDGRLAPVAAQLAGTVRDYDLADVHAVIAQVPDEKRTDLILVLAAMVDPDRTSADLLEWTTRPARSRDGREAIRRGDGKRACPDCGRVVRADHLGRHRGGRQCRPRAARAA